MSKKKSNNNCLDGLRCPKCESLEPFTIRTEATAVMYDDGSDEVTDLEWGHLAYVRCHQCGFTGKAWQLDKDLPKWVALTDWELLRRQKEDLLEFVSGITATTPAYEAMRGIIHLLDSVQDWASDTLSIPNVFHEEKTNENDDS